jgi:hypothetical protein
MSVSGKVNDATLTSQGSDGSCRMDVNFGSDQLLSVIAVSLSSSSIRSGGNILVTVGSAVRNSGAKWKDWNKSFSVWGSGPVITQGMTGTVTFSDLQKSVYRVYTLTPSGVRQNKVFDSNVPQSSVSFKVQPSDQTLWYLVTNQNN